MYNVSQLHFYLILEDHPLLLGYQFSTTPKTTDFTLVSEFFIVYVSLFPIPNWGVKGARKRHRGCQISAIPKIVNFAIILGFYHYLTLPPPTP